MKRMSIVLVFLAVLLTACGANAQVVKVGSIEVVSPWVLAADSGGNTAAYMTIKNTGSSADKLIKVEFAGAMETGIHETKMTGDMMEMAPVESLEIPAKGQVELKTGGYHVMMMGLSKDLKSGEKVNLTLTFEKAGSVTADIEVRNP